MRINLSLRRRDPTGEFSSADTKYLPGCASSESWSGSSFSSETRPFCPKTGLERWGCWSLDGWLSSGGEGCPTWLCLERGMAWEWRDLDGGSGGPEWLQECGGGLDTWRPSRSDGSCRVGELRISSLGWDSLCRRARCAAIRSIGLGRVRLPLFRVPFFFFLEDPFRRAGTCLVGSSTINSISWIPSKRNRKPTHSTTQGFQLPMDRLDPVQTS